MSRRNGIVIAAVLAALLVLVSGALALARMLRGSTPPSAVTQQHWKLDAFTFDGQPQVLVPGTSITLSFDAQTHEVSGSNGCNFYGASYSVSQDHLHLGELRQTAMGCLKPGVMEQEAHYMTALSLITTYHLDQTGLALRDDGGRYALHFIAATS
ncbi:MAG TPA: META domain-containing protein [Ktedonobacterales bacterium]